MSLIQSAIRSLGEIKLRADDLTPCPAGMYIISTISFLSYPLATERRPDSIAPEHTTKSSSMLFLKYKNKKQLYLPM